MFKKKPKTILRKNESSYKPENACLKLAFHLRNSVNNVVSHPIPTRVTMSFSRLTSLSLGEEDAGVTKILNAITWR